MATVRERSSADEQGTAHRPRPAFRQNLRDRLAPRNAYGALLIVFLGAVIVPPVLFLIWTSFRTGTPGRPDVTFTLSNWANLLAPENFTPIRNTLHIAAVTTLTAVPVAFFFAWIELQTDTPFVKRLSSLLIVPLVFSPLLTTIAWTILLAPRSGLVNRWASDILPIERLMDIYSISGMIFVSTLYFVPIAYLTIRSSLRTVDASTFEAARACGASTATALRRVLIPLLTPAIGAAALLTFTLSIGLFSVVTLLGPTARVSTLQLDVYFSMIESPTNPPHAAAVGVFLLLITLVNLTIYRRFLRNPKRFVTVSGKGFRSNYVRLGPWRWAALAVVLGYLFLAIVLPYLALVYAAFSPFLSPELNLGNMSTRNFETFFSRSDMVVGLWNTGKLVVVGAALTTFIALSVGYLVRRLSAPGMSRTLESIAMFPLAVPALSFAIGMLWFVLSFAWGRDNIYGTLLIIYFAQLATFLPLGVQIVASGVVQLGNDMEDSARTSGINGIARMGRIVLPLLKPTLASAWIILALYASVEAGLSVFLFTGRSVTTAVNVFNNALHGLPNVMYAGAMILATFGLVTIAIGNWFFRASKYLSGSD